MNSQRDKRWAGEQLGTCKGNTIGGYGCYITSITNLAQILGTRDTNPSKMNKWLTKNVGYVNGCLLNSSKGAEYCNLVYKGRFNGTNVRYCIIETNYYKKAGVPQHFVVYDTKKKLRIDPLDKDPVWEANNYPIVSYRVFDTPVMSTKTPEVAVNTTAIPKIEAVSGDKVKIVIKEPEIEIPAPVEAEPKPNNDKPMLQGYKTYIGLAVTLFGVLGLTKYVAPDELEKGLNLTLELIGIGIAIYGRYMATKK